MIACSPATCEQYIHLLVETAESCKRWKANYKWLIIKDEKFVKIITVQCCFKMMVELNKLFQNRVTKKYIM